VPLSASPSTSPGRGSTTDEAGPPRARYSVGSAAANAAAGTCPGGAREASGCRSFRRGVAFAGRDREAVSIKEGRDRFRAWGQAACVLLRIPALPRHPARAVSSLSFNWFWWFSGCKFSVPFNRFWWFVYWTVFLPILVLMFGAGRRQQLRRLWCSAIGSSSTDLTPTMIDLLVV
jgi:hypothetical protein